MESSDEKSRRAKAQAVARGCIDAAELHGLGAVIIVYDRSAETGENDAIIASNLETEFAAFLLDQACNVTIDAAVPDAEETH